MRLRRRRQSLVDDRHKLIEQLLRDLGVVQDLRGRVFGVPWPRSRRRRTRSADPGWPRIAPTSCLLRQRFSQPRRHGQASRIAVSFTASATLSSVAIFSSARPSCRLLLPSGAELLHGPAVRVHRVGGTRLHRRLRLVCICRRFFLCALQRCARTSGFAFSHHASLHLTTGWGDDRSVKSEIVIFLFFQMWWTVFLRYTRHY